MELFRLSLVQVGSVRSNSDINANLVQLCWGWDWAWPKLGQGNFVEFFFQKKFGQKIWSKKFWSKKVFVSKKFARKNFIQNYLEAFNEDYGSLFPEA